MQPGCHCGRLIETSDRNSDGPPRSDLSCAQGTSLNAAFGTKRRYTLQTFKSEMPPYLRNASKFAALLLTTSREFVLQFHSLRHHPFANGSQSRFCREKTRGICSIPRLTSAPWDSANSQIRSLERRFLWSSVLSFEDTVSRCPYKQAFFEVSADVEFEINSLGRFRLTR
jgi:hypothetical protein